MFAIVVGQGFFGGQNLHLSFGDLEMKMNISLSVVCCLAISSPMHKQSGGCCHLPHHSC